MNFIYNWLLKGNRTEVVITLFSFIVTLAIVLSVNTILFTTIYWLSGGHFRTAFFVVYLLVSAYLISLTVKVALDSYRRSINEHPQGRK